MTKQVAVHEITLNVVDEGSGPPILLVHGFPLNGSMWQAQVEALRETHRVIAPDLRGFGQSSVTEGRVTMEQFSDDLTGLLDALGVQEPVVFCGLSMGGYVAWQFLQREPDRVRAVVLCDTRAVPDTPDAAEGREKMAQKVMEHGPKIAAEAMLPKLFGSGTAERNPQLVEQVRQMMLGTNPAGIAAAARGMAVRPDARDMLSEIAHPALVIVGEEDQISPVDEMREIADAIPNAEFVVIPDSGHMTPMEAPDAVNTTLRQFLKKTTGR